MTTPSERERPWWLLPPRHLPGAWWLAIAGPLLGLEYVAGTYSQFPLVYVIPVSLAAYYSGRRPALILAIAIPLAHVAFTIVDQHPTDLITLAATTVFRASVIVIMALWFARLSDLERALYDEVQTLKGLLPICSFCKSIRNDAGDWERLEGFISRHSPTEFSHCICPSCHQTHYADIGGRPAKS